MERIHLLTGLSFLMLFLLGSDQLHSQCGQGEWEWQNPLPQGNTLYDLHVFDKDSAVFVGTKGTIIRTMDGGSSWDISYCTDGGTWDLKHVHFVNDSTGWTVGESGTILHTEDGGMNWSQQNSGTSNYLLAVHFVDSSYGWVVGKNNTTLRTTDGGQNWSFHAAGDGWEDPRLATVKFKNDTVGWCAGSFNGEGRVFYTENGGQDWSERNNGISQQLNSLDLKADSTIRVVGSDGYLETSIDGGDTWSDTLLHSFYNLRSIDMVDSSRGWIVGEDGIYHSSDGWSTWHKQSDELELTAVQFVDSAIGWAVGIGGRIFRTTDGGTTWGAEHQGFSGGVGSLEAVHFENDSTGWAVGRYCDSVGCENGNIIHTSDGGNTWQLQKTIDAPEGQLNDVHFVDTLQGWVLGDGVLFRTMDGGTSWDQLLFGGWDFYHDVHFVDSSTGWYVGSWYDNPNNPRIVEHSEDGGNSWSSQNSSGYGLSSVHFINAMQGWAVGANGAIIHSDDGGSDWSPQSSGTNKNLNSVHFVDDSKGWAVGVQGTILHTDDGGDTWSGQYSGTSQRLNSVHFPSPDTGWAVGEKGLILHTRNGGEFWGGQENRSSADLNSVFFTNNSTGWTVGDNQTILYTTNSGGTTGISRFEGPERDRIKAFPNPVRDKVHVQVPENSPDELHLSLWDPLGRLVEQKTVSSTKESSHTVMDLSSLEEGVYVLRMRIGEKNYTKKLIKK